MMTPQEIKRKYEAGANGYFFTRDTMRFFGDTMRSFGVVRVDDSLYLYRKPSGRVNVFGTWKHCGREFFSAWRFNEATGDLHHCDRETMSRVFAYVADR